MSNEAKRYPDYKDSGVSWLGKVPAHWQVLPNRALFQEVNDRDYPEEPLLSVTIEQGIIPQEVLLANTSKKDSSNQDKSSYKLVKPGDIAYNKMRAWQGAIGVSQYRGIVSPAYIVVRPRRRQVPEYYHYLFRTPGFVTEAERWSYGITSDMWSLRSEDFKQIYTVLPPYEEQQVIARYLDRFERLTDRYIRGKQRLIELLEEQKQALIQRAVTRGLDPDVPLKDSGVEWLGEIPEHWEIVRLKYVAQVQTGLTLGKNYGSEPLEERPYLRVANVQDGYLELSDVTTIHVPQSEIVRSELQNGDVLMTEGGDRDKLGRGAIWHNEIPGCLHQNHLFAVRANPGRLLPEYLTLLMTSSYGRRYFEFTAKQTTNLASTNSTTLGNFPLLLPSTKEQEQLVKYLNQKTAELDDALNYMQHQIDLVCEYRTRLIADVVTGKLDVRGVELPDLEAAVSGAVEVSKLD